MTINGQTLQRVWAIIRQLAAYASVILGAIPATGLPNAVRVPLVAFGGVLVAIEHYVADPSTGTPTAPTSAPPPPVQPPAA